MSINSSKTTSAAPVLSGEGILTTLMENTNNIPLVDYLGVSDQPKFILAMTALVNERVRIYRMTRRQLAQASGLSTSTIHRCITGLSYQREHNLYTPYYGSFRTYFRVAGALGMDIQEFVDESHRRCNAKRIKPKSVKDIRKDTDAVPVPPKVSLLERIKAFACSAFRL